MAHDGADMPKTAILSDLTDLTAAALPQIEAVLRDATSVVRASVDRDGGEGGRSRGGCLGAGNPAGGRCRD